MQQITLYQLNQLIQETLDQHLERSYWVVAEIGEIRVNQKGHCYLDLVEKEGQKLLAKTRANIWAYDYYNLSNMFRSVTGQPLKAGMKLLSRVVVQYHEVYGLSLQIKDLEPNFTLGERARHRQQVIERLTNEQVLYRNKNLPLPLVPQRVAVISSRTAAGYGDFMDQLINNTMGYAFELTLLTTVMQGEQAVSSVISALKKAGAAKQQFDLVVLIRGGGSQIDLDCFDDYSLALEITRCPLPVITGIGHLRDDTVADMVAHTKMKTPTAVAEFLLNGMEVFDQQLDFQADRIKDLARQLLTDQRTKLFGLMKNLGHSATFAISNRRHKLQLLHHRMSAGAAGVINSEEQKILQFQQAFRKTPDQILSRKLKELEVSETKLKLADPANILKRGYTITYSKGKVLTADSEVQVGDEITTRLAERTIKSNITDINQL